MPAARPVTEVAAVFGFVIEPEAGPETFVHTYAVIVPSASVPFPDPRPRSLRSPVRRRHWQLAPACQAVRPGTARTENRASRDAGWAR